MRSRRPAAKAVAALAHPRRAVGGPLPAALPGCSQCRSRDAWPRRRAERQVDTVVTQQAATESTFCRHPKTALPHPPRHRLARPRSQADTRRKAPFSAGPSRPQARPQLSSSQNRRFAGQHQQQVGHRDRTRASGLRRAGWGAEGPAVGPAIMQPRTHPADTTSVCTTRCPPRIPEQVLGGKCPAGAALAVPARTGRYAVSSG